ncbi:MAG TPA: hypothetical protein VM686_22980, partial [Polyangiaceae bacterium]|nr:hypothetical protein [Polyangiaceae bacterium]
QYYAPPQQAAYPSAQNLATAPTPAAAFGATVVGVGSPDHYGPATAPAGGQVHPHTLVGVAHPGIAPLDPGAARAPTNQFPQYVPHAPHAPHVPPAPPMPTVVSPGSSRAPTSSRRVGADRINDRDNLKLRKAKRALPLGAIIAIASAVALLGAALLAVFFYDSRGALAAQVALDGEGKERLELTCDKCGDDAIARHAGQSARFKNHRAALVLSRPLMIGDNHLELELERSPGKSEKVELTVPVEYRVHGETAALDDKEPRLRVRIMAVPGTTVVVDGRPVTLNPDGTGSADVDVSSSIRGQEPNVRRLERRIPYTITPPGSPTHSGEVAVQLGITPLTIDAPGESIVIDSPTFVLAGRTFKGGNVSVEGRAITVDNFGKFAQMMNVSSAGETTITVRASAGGHAPRLVPIRIRRVENLSSEIAAARAQGAASYAGIGAEPESKRGTPVVLDGSVIEARTENFATVMLLDVKSGCSTPPCLVKVTYGAKAMISSGDPVVAVGKVSGGANGPRENSTIPAIAADFVVKAGK